MQFNPHLPNGLSHSYQLDESICHLRGVWYTFFIFILFLIEIPVSKHCWLWSDAAFCGVDQTPRSAASDLGLHCLLMSQKWDARLICVNVSCKDFRSGTRLNGCPPFLGMKYIFIRFFQSFTANFTTNPVIKLTKRYFAAKITGGGRRVEIHLYKVQ